MDCIHSGSSVLGDSLGKNTGVGCHALLQGIFPIQGSNPSLLYLLHWQVGYLPPEPPGKPNIPLINAYLPFWQSETVFVNEINTYFLSFSILKLHWLVDTNVFSSVQSLSRVWLFVTPWTTACQAPCTSPAPGVHPNPSPLSRWCHPLSSPSPPAFNPSQHQGLFQWVSSSHQVARVLEFQLQHPSLQWTPRTDLLQDGLVGSPCSPRDSQECSPTPQFKSVNSLALSFLYNVLAAYKESILLSLISSKISSKI